MRDGTGSRADPLVLIQIGGGAREMSRHALATGLGTTTPCTCARARVRSEVIRSGPWTGRATGSGGLAPGLCTDRLELRVQTAQ